MTEAARRAIVVCGCQAAGNRLVMSYLVAAGAVGGTGTTRQPCDAELPVSAQLLAVIRHAHGSDGMRLAETLALLGRTHHVTAVVPVRDRWPHVRSLVAAGHAPDEAAARELLDASVRMTFAAVAAAGCPCVVQPYEALVQRPVRAGAALLAELGLDSAAAVRGAATDDQLAGAHDANARWYAAEPAPHYRVEHGGEPVWYPRRQLGYFPVRSFAKYDLAYFERYEQYRQTDLGRALNEQRLEFVRRCGVADDADVLDFGSGAGHFLDVRDAAAPGHTFGYDVNPASVGWLRGRGRWRDPWAGTPPRHVTCWDSLEHLPSPGALVERVLEIVCCSVPLVESGDAMLASPHYREDEHFWYWSADALVRWFAAYGFRLVLRNDFETRLERREIGTFGFRREGM